MAVVATLAASLLRADDLTDLREQLHALQTQMNQLEAKIEKAAAEKTKPPSSEPQRAAAPQQLVTATKQSHEPQHGFSKESPATA